MSVNNDIITVTKDDLIKELDDLATSVNLSDRHDLIRRCRHGEYEGTILETEVSCALWLLDAKLYQWFSSSESE